MNQTLPTPDFLKPDFHKKKETPRIDRSAFLKALYELNDRSPYTYIWNYRTNDYEKITWKELRGQKKAEEAKEEEWNYLKTLSKFRELDA